MVRVFTNIPALLSARGLATAESLFTQTTERLSTGLRINRPSDDPGGFSISSRLRSRVLELESAEAGVQDGISLTQTADSGVERIIELLQELRTLAVQSTSGTATTADRNANDLQFHDLVAEINRIASNTSFNGKVLLNGAFATGVATLRLQLGPESQSFTTLNIRTLNSVALGVSDEHVNTVAAASAALIAVSSALNIVRVEAGNVGGKLRRLENAAEFLEDQQLALQTGIAGHTDADIAEETINLTKASILRDLAASTLAQTRSFPADSIRIILGIST